MVEKAKRILIAEDEEADVLLMQIVLEELGLRDSWAVAHDGKEALDYLYQRGDQASRAAGKPELILLDLKLPKVNGLEVLQKIREDERFKPVAVVIFSSSLDENDRAQAMSLGADDFMIKPMDFNDFRAAIGQAVSAHVQKLRQ